jgi:putative oxidoreductase
MRMNRRLWSGDDCDETSTSTKEASMNLIQRNALALARVLLSLVFFANGFGIIPQAVAAKELAEHGAPAALVPLLMFAARTIEIVGGFGLMLGIYPRIAAIAIIAFLIPATLVAHEFWSAVATPAFAPQLLQFLKNTAMTGGLLLIATTPNQPALFPRTSWSKNRE